jgi:hypothetical protein
MHAPASFRFFHDTAFRLRRTSWLELAGYAMLGLFGLSLLRMAMPQEMGPALKKLGLVLALALLAAKDLSHLPDARLRLRVATSWRARIAALLPPELLGMLRLDRLLRQGFLHTLRRRAPAPARPDGIALTYLRQGAYGTAIAVAMVSLFIEMPVHHLIMHVVVDDPDKRLLLHLAGAVAALSSFAWVLGDRWHVGAGQHVLADGVLHLQVGVRSQGSIPLDAVERFEAITETPERWRRRHGIQRADTMTVTPFDKPNCVLVMKPDADLTLLHWQVRRPVPRYLLLYLDRPALLASACR